jgi:hypothetical protein
VDTIDVKRSLDRLLRKVGVKDSVRCVWPLPPVALDGPEVEDDAT